MPARHRPATAFALLAVCLLAVTSVRAADAPTAVPIWPADRMPGKGAAQAEGVMPSKGDGVTRVTNVSVPTLTLFPAPGGVPAPALVVCPGGGYGILAFDKEGTEIATWLNTIGVTALVLKYRVPGNRDGAFQDIQRAVRLARAQGAHWGVDAGRVGVLGFSAGGHLCARAATAFATASYPALDESDAKACRPDVAVLVYPAYLEEKGVLAPGLPMGPETPPIAIVHTDDDHTFVPGSRIFHAALEAAKVPNEFFLFPTGGHGYGLRCTGAAKAWPEKVAAWLQPRFIAPVAH